MSRRLLHALLGLGVLIVLVAAPAASAAPGELDPTFGLAGKVVTPLSYGGRVAVQPDGKVLVTGGSSTHAFSVLRLLPNGSPDPTWGVNGTATIPLGVPAQSTDVAVQPDGKIVAVGNAGSPIADFVIVRYLSNGLPDPSFGGGDGVVEVPIGTEGNNARAVAIGPGGRIGVTGYTRLPGSKHGAAVVMLEANGTPEAAFSGDGIAVIETESSANDRGEGIAFQPDGKVVIADSTGGGNGDGFTIVRLDLSGALDPSFGGGDGVVETPIPGESEPKEGRVSDVVIQPDGKIVGGGSGADYNEATATYTNKFALARYLPNGELDPTFGTGGIVSTRLPGGNAFGRSLALAPTGKLIIGGTWEPAGEPLENRYAPALLRYLPNGQLDPTFGSGGIVQLAPSSPFWDESIEGIALAADGKIVAGGEGYPKVGESSVIVSRYFGDPPPPPPPPPPVPNQPPHAQMKAVPKKAVAKKLKEFSGTASDPDGSVGKVQIAVVKKTRRHAKSSRQDAISCFAMKNAKGGFKRMKPQGKRCPQLWLTAKGTTKWRFRLKGELPPGHYIVYARAIDTLGLAEATFSTRLHNRYAFRIAG